MINWDEVKVGVSDINQGGRMKAGLLVVACAMVLGGCAGTESYFDGKTGTRMIDTGTVNALNPSSSLMEVERCDGEVVQAYEWEDNYNDGTVIKHFHPEECKAEGGWRNVQAVGGYQPGYALAPVTTAIGGAAFVTGMDRFGNKMNTSDTNIQNDNNTSSNGGNSLSSARSDAYSNSNAAAAASGGAGGNGYGYGGKGGSGGSVINKGHRR